MIEIKDLFKASVDAVADFLETSVDRFILITASSDGRKGICCRDSKSNPLSADIADLLLKSPQLRQMLLGTTGQLTCSPQSDPPSFTFTDPGRSYYKIVCIPDSPTLYDRTLDSLAHDGWKLIGQGTFSSSVGLPQFDALIFRRRPSIWKSIKHFFSRHSSI